MGDLMLIPAVIIHGPNFFVSGFRAHVSNLRLRDAGQAAAQARNYVVGELMCQAARVGVRSCAAIDFLQRNRRGRVVNVRKKPCGSEIRSFH